MQHLSIPPGLGRQLIQALEQKAEPVQFAAHTELLRQGQYIKVIPVVRTGLIKVFTRHEDKELLLYYIQPGESCIMSFSAALGSDPSEVFAIAEEDSEVLLIPAEMLQSWMHEMPLLAEFFYKLFHERYHELIRTIQQLLYEKLDGRLLNYLRQRMELSGSNTLKITHQQIANELGSSREVISRLLKKLEREGKVQLAAAEIKILSL